MRLPRDVSGQQLATALGVLGYMPARQQGDHLCLATLQNGEHHLTFPLHRSLRIGTFSAILSDVEEHFGLNRDQLLERLSL